MYPILVEFGPVVIPAWHTFFLIGAISAYFILHFLRKRSLVNLDEKQLNGLYLSGYIGGYFGARLFSIFNDQQVFNPIEVIPELFVLGPMTFYGGAIGCLLCCILFIRIRKLPLGDCYDVGILAGLTGLAFGRIGCFLNGDDYGRPVDLVEGMYAPWWSVVFPNLQDGIPRYPVQLISTLVVGMLVIVLVKLGPRIRQAFGPGSVGLIATAAYANFRFFVEFYRGDLRGTILMFSTSQFISLVVLGLVLAVALLKVARSNDESSMP